MARDELFAGLCFLGCINGLGGRVIQSIYRLGWTAALLTSFDTSVITWVACGASLWFLLCDKEEAIQPADLAVAAGSLLLIVLPTGGMSWLALTALSLYMLLFSHPPPWRRRGAVILLALTVPMLWSRLAFHFLANPILNIDASLTGWVLGTDRVGNMVRFADGSASYMMILPTCSSLANTSLGLLSWVTISQIAGHRWSPRDLLSILSIGVAMIVGNVTRLSLTGLSVSNYTAIHNQWGDDVFNLIGLAFAIGISLFSVRHELFSHP